MLVIVYAVKGVKFMRNLLLLLIILLHINQIYKLFEMK